MKSHLTLRLPAELARALARWARIRRVPKSALVREAVARYLAPNPPPVPPTRRVTARELAALLASLPHLSREQAEVFARDLETARSELARLEQRDPWES
ncbi:MAG: ribbon-helix-helix protein, CopG family [Gemmatimonadales bacterium]